MIAIWLPPSFIKFKKQTLVALSSINSKRMVGFQRFCLSVFTSTATNLLQCTHCWNFSFTHLALLLNFSHYDQQIIKNGKFKQPLRLSSTPTSSSCISHLFTPSLSTFLIQHKCCPDVRQQSLKEDIQNDKAIKEEERAIQKWLRENHREDAPPSFLPSTLSEFCLPLFSLHLFQNNRHSGKFMKLMKVKDWAFHMHQGYISYSYLIHVVFI